MGSMQIVLCFAVAVAMAAAATVELSVEELALRDKARRDQELQAREIEYHKELHKTQERIVASLRRPHGAYRDTPTNPGDLEALKAIYQSTNGSNWVNNTRWLKGDPCTYPFWFGLYCIDGRVLQINLVYNGLTGSLPASAFTKLTALQVLRLYSNQLTGDIPESIFASQSLQIIDLNSNMLTGGLPSTINMANLTQLTVYDNNLKGEIPGDIYAPNLQILEISSNNFYGELPTGLARSNLTDLVVSRNALTGSLPSAYGELTNLKKLWTFYNNFDRPILPDTYQKLTNMEEIQADGLSGEFPDWIGNWRKLQYLILINGWLSGNFPSSICDCEDMISLRLFNNSLKGELPDCICNMRKMTDFEVSDNQFMGEIPDVFQDCRSLQTFYVSRNNFTGEFPSSLGYPVNMTVIDVGSNGLYGRIPNTINNLKENIAEFAICFNMFSDVESGMDGFFNRIIDYSCLFYNNPWSCPLSTQVPKECTATCSDCNKRAQHESCSACVQASSDCGWCSKGNNCLRGNAQGPDYLYQCKMDDWTSGADSC